MSNNADNASFYPNTNKIIFGRVQGKIFDINIYWISRKNFILFLENTGFLYSINQNNTSYKANRDSLSLHVNNFLYSNFLSIACYL